MDENKDGEKEIQAVIDTLKDDEASTKGYLKMPFVWAACVLVFFVGFLVGHL